MSDKKELKGDQLNDAFKSFLEYFQPHTSGEAIYLETYDVIYKILTMYPGYFIDSIEILQYLKTYGFKQSIDVEDLSWKWKVEMVSN